MEPQQLLPPPDQSEPRSNANFGLLHTPSIFRTEASPSDIIYCHTQDIYFLGWGYYVYAEDTVRIIKSPPTRQSVDLSKIC